MKKNCLLFFLILFILMGCSANIEKELPDIKKAIQSDASDDQFYFTTDSIARSKNGYFYMLNNWMYFFNNNTKTSSLICKKIDCKHKETPTNCDAFFAKLGENFYNITTKYSNDTLYLVSSDKNEDETYTIYLNAVSLDGSKRTRLFSLYTLERSIYFTDFIIHKDYLFRTDIIEGKLSLYCCYINGDGLKEIIFTPQYDDYEINNITCFGDDLYFQVFSYIKNDIQTAELYKYNTKTKKTDLVFDSFMSREYYLINDSIYYNSFESNVVKRNIKTKKEEILIENKEKGVYKDLSFDGWLLYVKKMGDTDKTYIYDLDGKEINTIKHDTKGTVMYGYFDYLFYKPSQAESNQNEPTYWLIEKSKLRNDNIDWIKLDN